MEKELNIRFVGNSPVLVGKVHDYLYLNGLKMTHYNKATNRQCDYFIVIDPIEEAIKRMRVQEVWKEVLKEKHSEAKMIVLDWWVCHCNGFISPMDIPTQIDDFLAIGQPLNEIAICSTCHAKSKEGFQRLFNSHGALSVEPLIEIQNALAGLVNDLMQSDNDYALRNAMDLQKKVEAYQIEFERVITISLETPFCNLFSQVQNFLKRLIGHIIPDPSLGNEWQIQNMNEEVQVLIERIALIGTNAQLI
jgi:hypothetical protein